MHCDFSWPLVTMARAHEACTSVGIVCFVHDGVGVPFRGDLKTHTTDFVVSEIDRAGMVASLDAREDEVQETGECHDVTASMTRGSSMSREAYARAVDGAVATEDRWEKILGGSENARLLQAFGDRIRMHGCLKDSVPPSLILKGLCSITKHDRNVACTALRRRFPFLTAAPTAVSSEERYDLVVAEDRSLSEFESVLDRDEVLKLYDFVANSRDSPGGLISVTFRPVAEKENRKRFHVLCHRLFRKWAVTSTSSTNELVITRRPRHHQRKTRTTTTYTCIVIRKDGIDQAAAVEELSKRLRISRDHIGIAGTKDKRAVTYQYATVANLTAADIRARVSAVGDTRISVGDLFRRVPKPLQLGDLQGNRFRITLRNVSPTVDAGALHAAMSRLESEGFVNYFGLQRLGKYCVPRSPRPFEIGAALLAKQWKKAVSLLLAPRVGEAAAVTTAKLTYHTAGDVARALKLMPRHMHHERQVLQGLKRFGGREYQKAFSQLSFRSRTMYVHAFQSYVWNHLATKRWSAAGKNLVVGDIVRVSGGHRCLGAGDLDVSAADSVSIHDVVVPMPGSETRQTLETNEIYRGVVDDCFQRFSLSWLDLMNVKGAYRTLLARPTKTSVDVASDGSVVMDYSLESSVYATVCLREIMQDDGIMACDGKFSDWEEYVASVKFAHVGGKRKRVAPAVDSTRAASST